METQKKVTSKLKSPDNTVRNRTGKENLLVGQLKKERILSMIKQEISEIKKLFTERNCSITRICGCYVDGEKNKKTELK